MTEATKAYYAGRTAAWDMIEAGDKPSCPYTDAALVAEFRKGFTSACREERLNVSVDWD